jgi:DNA-binding IclR family transcriptional regulator
VASWSFLASHARVLLCFARDPGVRLRDAAAGLGITGRGACGVVTGLTAAGYMVKQEDSRRSRYQIQAYLLLPGADQAATAIGDILVPLRGRRRETAADRDGPASGHRS